MLGIVLIDLLMSLRDFFHHFFTHLLSAACILAILLVTAEFIVPGSVLPFFDLVDGLFVLFGLLILTIVILPKSRSTP